MSAAGPPQGAEPPGGKRSEATLGGNSTAPPIDLTTFRELESTAGADFVQELAATFLAEAPRMLDDLRAAVDAGDAERFRRTAHSLKSNGNTFGATSLGAIAKSLELGGLPSARVDAGAALTALEAEYARVATALKELGRA